MTDLNRRRFLQVAGGTAAATMLTDSIARAAAIPANFRTGTLRDVEHVVVLMQENRSFDHYFGSLRGVRGFGDPRPVTLPSGKPVWYQSDGQRDILPFRPQVKDLGLQFVQDLPHGWNDTHAAWHDGRYDQWVPAKSSTTMAYLTREDIPFHYALADTFTICDAYHCSFMGSTDPNRYYLWTGYTGNDGKGGGPVIGNDEAGYSWTTYPERLEQAGVSWKIYQDVGDGLDAAGSWGWIPDAYRGNYGDNSLLYFDQYRKAQPGNPLYDKARTGTDAKNGDGFFDVLKADVKGGRLPQVSWVVAPEAFTEHPNWPANYGAWYVSQVLDALTASPEVWSKTALFITYDENDGFFDHVVPPYPPASADQGASTVDTQFEILNGVPYGLGQRVPMLVVSPWSKGGRVCSEVFDHTSIIRFLERRFGVREPNISTWRRSVTGDLTSAFDFSRRETVVPPLPSTAAYEPPDRDRHPDYVPTPPGTPALPRQEAGRRPALPLPYDLAADGKLSGGRFTVDFANNGKAGACFYVTSPGAGPRSYTVGAGGRLSAAWDVTGAYDYTVHGPNGFFRRFAGQGSGVEVTARAAGQDLGLVLTNGGKDAVSVTVAVAPGYGPARDAEYRLRPGARVVHVVRTAEGWYDVSVTAGSTVRRLAGHLETGRITLTDPGFGAR
ncbi:phospholipase C [Amycolatopsis bartoniae]|uniref:phospholipase C n=1 Tax=Amycolatopsis bartoniae TaxID=941986 RepID=A0A8H9IY01_9PSEU|nr:phospholipase C, phosphocholine-specific [Amycolatopsis bartoniae]MBB2936456.1 phospholipase C [Amycolatopsis bartoniae]TVT11058.1 phospholipase C, phosphocholine-specific [Amycolatopsis bartoniae]GHF68809.1 phospholipase C, phosphocholine-specific [Amycolatopsis bartoniae]